MTANGLRHEDGTHPVVASLYDGVPIFDARAKSDCNDPLHELRQEKEEAARARCAVTKRIKQAIQKLADTLPALGHRSLGIRRI